MRAVLDTNVFVSGIHWTGASEKVLRAWFKERFVLVTSLPIVQEFVETMKSFRIPIGDEDIAWWESLMLEKSVLVSPQRMVAVVKADPDDDKFVEAAVEGDAGFIISQDKHLLSITEYEGIKMILPQDFLALMKQT